MTSTRSTFFFLSMAIFLCFSENLHAQLYQDVCCLMSHKTGNLIETRALVMSKSDCSSSKKHGDYTPETFLPDPNNEVCPGIKSEEICKKMGFFLDGSSCVAEDPNKKVDELKQRIEELEKSKKPKPSSQDSEGKKSSGSSAPVSTFPSP